MFSMGDVLMVCNTVPYLNPLRGFLPFMNNVYFSTEHLHHLICLLNWTVGPVDVPTAFCRTPGCKLTCRLHLKAEDSGYKRRRVEERKTDLEKRKPRRRTRGASAFIFNPAGESFGLSLWDGQRAAAAAPPTPTHTREKYTEIYYIN